MGKIHLKKTDKESEEALAGAVFNVIAAENITTPDGTLQAAKAEVVTTLTTGSDGTATNTPNEVKIKKVAADSQEALAGVEFQVWKKGTSAKDNLFDLYYADKPLFL